MPTEASKQSVKDSIVMIGGSKAEIVKPPRHSKPLIGQSSQMSLRNNFEHNQSRKAILKHTLAEIEREIGTI